MEHEEEMHDRTAQGDTCASVQTFDVILPETVNAPQHEATVSSRHGPWGTTPVQSFSPLAFRLVVRMPLRPTVEQWCTGVAL